MKLCKHEPHKIIDWVKDPKWSTDEILINVDAISKDIEHYIIKFSNESPSKKYGWFYMSGAVIRKCKTQPNGHGSVYVVPMSSRESFEPLKQCKHEY